MDSDLECQHRVAKKFLSEEDKKEEKNFLPDSNFISLKKKGGFSYYKKKRCIIAWEISYFKYFQE